MTDTQRPRTQRHLSGAVNLWKRGQVWQADWRDPITRKRERRSLGVEDEALARSLADEIERDNAYRVEHRDAVRYLDVLATYLRTIKKRSTLQTWQMHARRWEMTIGPDPWLHQITEAKVAEHVDRRRRHGVSDATIRGELTFMGALFQHQRVPPAANPVRLYGLRRVKPARKVVRWLTPEEEAALLKACGQLIHRQLIIVAIETGLRNCERVNCLA